MSTTSKLITGEELLAVGDIGPCELIYGEVAKLSPSGYQHGQITFRLGVRLNDWRAQHGRGEILAAETGFRLQRDPDLVRAADIAFVESERAPDDILTGFFEGAPDLAVEVISPTDSWPEVEAKVECWLSHGCRSCWVVDPRNRGVTVYRQDGSITKFKENDDLLDPTLPGFHTPVAAIFAR